MSSTVKCWTGTITLSTWEVEREDSNPPFIEIQSGPLWFGKMVYPYTMQNLLAHDPKNVTHRAIFLENRYLRLIILPDKGGRLYSAFYKIGNRETFAKVPIFKPCLIGIRGAFVAGGIEFNDGSSSGHSIENFSPVDHLVRHEQDGSATVMVGATNKVLGIKWLVSIILYPNRAYFETRIRLFNRSLLPSRYYFWSNASIPTKKRLRYIFPMSQAYYERDLGPYPIYQGIDRSWHANYLWPISIFGHDIEDDFFASYDYDEDAGVAHVANRFECPGAKIFDWGGVEGPFYGANLEMIEACEIQSGKLETQMVTDLIEPQGVKMWKEYWYPYQGIGSPVRANRDAILSMDMKPLEGAGKKVKIGVYTTRSVRGEVSLRTFTKVLYRKKVNIIPDRPFKDEIQVYVENPAEVTLSLLDNEGKEVITYTLEKIITRTYQKSIKEAPLTRTIEELYLAGINEEFRKGWIRDESLAIQLYEEALEHDPEFSPALCRLGLIFFTRGLYEKGETFFRRALQRDATNSELHYYLGLTLKSKGENEEAERELWRASEGRTYASPAYYALGEIALADRNYEKAENLFIQMVSTNPQDLYAKGMLAAILRKRGKVEEALQLINKALKEDPLEYLINSEKYFALKETVRTKAEKSIHLKKILSRDADSFIELAINYGKAGLYKEAVEVLAMAIDPALRANDNSLIHIFMGYYLEKMGKAEDMDICFRRASELKPEYIFPYHLEAIDALKRVIKNNPADGKLHYYLGNLLYSKHRYEEAIAEWEEAERLMTDFSVLHRNLGLAYNVVKKNPLKAAEEYERAIDCDRDDYTLYIELNNIYVILQDNNKRLSMLEKAPRRIRESDEWVAILASVYMDLRNYDRVLEILCNHTFTPRESFMNIRNLYVDACISRGKSRLERCRFIEAIEDFEAGMQYPLNLGVPEPYKDRKQDVKALYLMGLAYDNIGNMEKAYECWKKAFKEKHEPWSEHCYYEGLVLQKLGMLEEANSIFNYLIEFSDEQLKVPNGIQLKRFFSFGPIIPERVDIAICHFLKGLGFKGKANREKAKEELLRALSMNPLLRHVRMELEDLIE
jgi:tetratricopeptide (TPR) repeat protein